MITAMTNPANSPPVCYRAAMAASHHRPAGSRHGGHDAQPEPGRILPNQLNLPMKGAKRRRFYLKTRTEPHRENLKDDYNKVSQMCAPREKELALEKWFYTKIKRLLYKDRTTNTKTVSRIRKWIDISNANARH